MTALQPIIEAAWEVRDTLSASTDGRVRGAVEAIIERLDEGTLSVATGHDHGWVVHEWIKKAVLLSFRLNDMEMIAGGPGGAHWWDKVPSKFSNWSADDFRKAGFRAVPGSIVRRGAFIAPGAVLMPCFVNIGASVGENTMIDTWATVGSCAQIGANVHLSGGAGIGGIAGPWGAPAMVAAAGAGACPGHPPIGVGIVMRRGRYHFSPRMGQAQGQAAPTPSSASPVEATS